jgi:PAS domain S-box-containing protein
MHNIIASHKLVMRELWCLTEIAEQAGEGVAVFHLDGTIRFANATWTAMHGYDTRHELIGKHISMFHTKEQMKSDVIPFVEEAKRKGQLIGPVEHMRRGGTPFLTEMKMIVVRDEGGKGVGLISFVTDITERKRTEKQLRQQAAALTATNEQLQRETAERNQREEELQQYRKQLEEQTAELTAVNEKLKQQISRREQVET